LEGLIEDILVQLSPNFNIVNSRLDKLNEKLENMEWKSSSLKAFSGPPHILE